VIRRGEAGHLMVGLLAAIAIMMIFSTVVYQEWSELMRREWEEEMIFRAKELSRGIQRYRVDHGGMGPTSLDKLMEPGPKGQYYLRRLYNDPLVKDGKWGLLYQGPGGAIIDPSAVVEGMHALTPVSQFKPSVSGNTPAAEPGEIPNLTPVTGGMGSGEGEETGLPIAGVKSLATDQPFRIYNGFESYSEWLFTYLDLEGGGQKAPGQLPGAPGGPQPGGLNPPGAGGSSPGLGGSFGKGQGGAKGKGKGQGEGTGGSKGGQQSSGNDDDD
jgi:hypothetical protein